MIYEGRMAYFGPAKKARQYFINLGYEPAHRQTTPDFLVAVTDPNARIPRQIDTPIPRAAADFAAAFLTSTTGQNNKEQILTYRAEFFGKKQKLEDYANSARAEHNKMARSTSPYIQSIATQAKEVMIRRIQIFRGAMLITAINIL